MSLTAATQHDARPGRLARSLAAQPITIVTEPPGPQAREMIARAMPHLSPSLIHCYPLMVRRASGCMVEDVDGNVYLDAEAGVATASTGHCHPAVAAAIADAGRDADPHLRHRLPLPGLRRDLREARRSSRARIGPEAAHDWQTFLTNSGTEAVEAAHQARAQPHAAGRASIAFRGGFHGRTLGSLSLTASKSKYRKGFGPLLPDVLPRRRTATRTASRSCSRR